MMKKISRKVVIIALGTVLGLGVVALITWLIISGARPVLSPAQIDTTGTTPPFQAILPAESSINDFGGWSEFTSPGGDTFYSFTDTIDGVKIRVSQQVLPDDFKNNTAEKIAEVAKSYSATNKLEVSNLTVFMGVSARGQQSVILTKNGLLLLIQSQNTISDESWVSYIQALQQLSAS